MSSVYTVQGRLIRRTSIFSGAPAPGLRERYGAGLSTYPMPRRVWIIGARPASIFLRRYEM
ncbi:hypothetical protein AC230_10750 [Streptomyces caatingaensis]|uniref:Uncharacterized protein n=1 Tax=Streptomyces caatingaensis TaxID=1678637 RepID=A0A0K9XH79_9ACTN|nr:hypothetical protein AC230_10750 [Streptomyces caatingaensis]